MSIPYRFAPWARRGLARSHRNPDAAGATLATRPKITVGLQLQAKQDGTGVTAVSGNIDLTLYGPADIIGIDPRLVVRTDPKPNVTNFEPNYLAVVDFDPPDFPWLLTPARANENNNLRPWLVLVVLDRSVVGAPAVKPGRPLPSVTVPQGHIASELPDLAESWLWAHAQAVSTKGKDDPAGIAAELKQFPERNISRLVCPRRLEPRKNYVACVVPATDGGRLRGLGQPVQSTTLSAAWHPLQQADIELPVYYHWEFSTGPVGDIETLARRLKRPEQYAGDKALTAKLRRIGQQPVYVDGDRLLFEGATPARTIFEGAMVSLEFKPDAPNNTFSEKLEAILNSGQALATQGTPKADTVPTLAPPIYGEHPAKRHTVKRAQVSSHWLDGLSLQPRYRLAAGWGAEVVRQNQDEFMQAAWRQVGEVLAAERAFSLARLSRDVLKRVAIRHLDKLPEARLLALLAPARARIKVGPEQSLYGRIGSATLPDELFDGAMRRLTSARRPAFRMAQWRVRNLAPASVPRQMTALVDTFANVTKHLDAVDPNRFVPDGLTGSASFDNIAIPGDLNAVVDLAPYTGLVGTMTAGEIKKIQQQHADAREQAIRTKRKLPQIGDVWRRGLITETHALRFAELERAAGRPLDGDIAKLIQQASPRGAEGVLLTVDQAGTVAGKALKIDARSGNLKSFGSTFIAGPERAIKASRAARIARGSIGIVPLRALKLYGNDAVFTTLPPNVLGQAGDAVHIGLTAPGQFNAVRRPGPTNVVPSITMPPAIKERSVLLRYSDAFKDYQKFWALPAADEGTVRPVDFALPAAAKQTRARVDPSHTVPARLASSLSLGDQAVAWTSAGLSNLFIATRLDVALAERLRYLIPLSYDRVMAYPHLLFPLSRKLEVLAPEVFLPGVGALPDDFIMAVQTNPRFVEALMVGANHEMGRELLWQGFPTDQRGTPFQHFWQRLDSGNDIAPINEWLAAPLGSQSGSTPMLVLLIRGQLLERFPTLSIYAYPRTPQESRPGGGGEMDPTRTILPVMKGRLNQDITYIGFNINPKKMEEYFFILEEQMTEPRFGFDEPDGEGEDGVTWLDVDWSEVGVSPGNYFDSSKLRLAAPAKNKPQWVTPHAATVADALLQRPFRGYYAGERLKTPSG